MDAAADEGVEDLFGDIAGLIFHVLIAETELVIFKRFPFARDFAFVVFIVSCLPTRLHINQTHLRLALQTDHLDSLSSIHWADRSIYSKR